jgi:polar amino acid transport system substrate-binding protein
MSATGLSVVVTDDQVSGGIYPDILQSVQKADGCTFLIKAVPRARLEFLFEIGDADLLIPASKTPERDKVGVFVPLIYNRATLISLESTRKTITTAQELIDNAALKVVLIRGYGYGPAYEQLVRDLQQQGRIQYETDPVSVARVLKLGNAQVTIMAPSILAGSLQADERVRDLADKLRFEPIKELPWGDSGAYVSRKSLGESDQRALRELLEQAARSGAVWRGFQKHYPANVLKESIRPR